MESGFLFPSNAIPFLITCLLIELTPGPNMTYLAIVSASDGRRAGVQTVLGITLGLSVLGGIAAFGAAEILQSSEVLYQLMRWSGVAFLLYLSWEGWVKGADIVSNQSGGFARYFARGLMTNLLNPKAALFYITVLPTFIVPVDIGRQALILTAIYVAVATAVHLSIVLLAGSLEEFLKQPERERLARRLLSVLLAAVALWFAWTTRMPI